MSKQNDWMESVAIWMQKSEEVVRDVSNELSSRLKRNSYSFEEFAKVNFQVLSGYFEEQTVFLLRSDSGLDCAFTFSTNAMGPEYETDNDYVWTHLEIRTQIGYAYFGSLACIPNVHSEGFAELWKILESVSSSRIGLKKLSWFRWLNLTTVLREPHMVEIYDKAGKVLCRSVINELFKRRHRSAFGEKFWSQIPEL